MRVPTDSTFIKDTLTTLGPSFVSRRLVLGFPIGLKEVNTKKVEDLTKTIFNSENKAPATHGSLLGKVIALGVAVTLVGGAYYLGIFSQLSNFALGNNNSTFNPEKLFSVITK